MTHPMTIEAAADALAAGTTTAAALTDAALARIADPGGEGARAFLSVREQARDDADAADRRRRAGCAARYDGIPFAAKDLFDVAGEVTRAGSRTLDGTSPAQADAPAVAQLRAAGFILVGRTNMTEFAYSGVGLNPHFPAPHAPWDRAGGRVPGGSSSGSAVAVADGMALLGLGTDTGGSCRIPAALCGVVGFKPTQRRVPLDGAFPLAPSLDSVGPLARSVACCAMADAILAGETPRPPEPNGRPNLLVPDGVALSELDPAVAAAFERALIRLSAAGARIAARTVPSLERVFAWRTGLTAIEAFAVHRERLALSGDRYDPRVRARIMGGAQTLAADYIDLLALRRAAIAAFARDTADVDGLIMPTAPILPPTIASLEGDDAAFTRANGLLLRNTAPFNLLDVCAISLPVSQDPPVGLMLTGRHGGDAALFDVAAWVEATLRD